MNDASEWVEELRERLEDHVEEGELVKRDLADLFASVAEGVLEQQSQELISVKADLAEHVAAIGRASKEPLEMFGEVRTIAAGVRQVAGLLEQREKARASERATEASRQARELAALGDGLGQKLAEGLESNTRATLEAFREELGELGQEVSGSAQGRYEELAGRLAQLSSDQSEQRQTLRTSLEESLEVMRLEQGQVKEDIAGRATEIREEIRVRSREASEDRGRARQELGKQMTQSTQTIRADLERLLATAGRLEKTSNKTRETAEKLSREVPALQVRLDTGFKDLEKRLVDGLSASQERLESIRADAEAQQSASSKDIRSSINTLGTSLADADGWSRRTTQELERKLLWGLGLVGSLTVLTTIIIHLIGGS